MATCSFENEERRPGAPNGAWDAHWRSVATITPTSAICAPLAFMSHTPPPCDRRARTEVYRRHASRPPWPAIVLVARSFIEPQTSGSRRSATKPPDLRAGRADEFVVGLGVAPQAPA